MKKKFLKLMTAAVALTTMVSCSDDLGINQGKNQQQKGDLTGTLKAGNGAALTRMGMYEGNVSPWQDEDNTNWGMVWTKGDVVRVYKINELKFNRYQLTTGWNTDTGVFDLKLGGGEKLNIEAGKDYAITDAQFAYGVSATNDGGAMLTYTIPYKYSAQVEEVTAGDGSKANVRRFPAPFWGDAKQNSDGTLDCDFVGLTAFLRIQMDQLPIGTKYIVLTTHGADPLTIEMNEGNDNGQMGNDGFLVAEPLTTKTGGKYLPKDFQDTYQWWYEGTYTGNPDFNTLRKITRITGGQSEPLSGTFVTELIKGEGADWDEVYANTVKQTYLREDKGLTVMEMNEAGNGFVAAKDDYGTEGISRLVTRDELIIDVTSMEGKDEKVFWVPIISRTKDAGQNPYAKLAVIAATELSKYKYCYIGTVLKEFTNEEFINGDYYTLTMSQKQLDDVCPYELNKAIAEINKANKYGLESTSILNVKQLKVCTHTWKDANNVTHDGHEDDNVYPTDRVLIKGNGNLEVNIADISDEGGAARTATTFSGHAVRNDVTMKAAQGKTLLVTDYFTGSYPTGGYKGALREDYKGEASEGQGTVSINLPKKFADANSLMSDLPTYDVVITTNNNDGKTPAAKTDLVVDAHGSLSKCVTGYNLYDNADRTALKNAKIAAINVFNTIKQLNVLEETAGDVYISPENNADVEITQDLSVFTKVGINTRIDDALVKEIKFQENSNDANYVFTTGSSAIQNVCTLTAPNAIPNDVRMQSYWTGAALNAEYAGISAYDNGKVYTVAQLASMGEKIGGSSTNKYYIVTPLVTEMWLGGTSQFRWLGAEVTVDGFEFDGRQVSLQNMSMPEVAKKGSAGSSKVVYTYDPHLCCTSCGWKRVAAGNASTAAVPDVPLHSVGLIRSIINSDAATIKNVNLNDVYLDSYELDENGAPKNIEVDNVGGIAGYIQSKDVKFFENYVGRTKINIKGDNVGGMIGAVAAGTQLTMKENEVTGSEGGQVLGENNVGGLVGASYVDSNNALYKADGGTSGGSGSSAGSGSSGGSVPGVGGGGGARTRATEVVIINTEKIVINSAKVSLSGNIAAKESAAGGLVGAAIVNKSINASLANVKAADVQAKEFAGGNFGIASGTDGGVYILGNSVDVANIKAIDGNFAGGLAGQLNATTGSAKVTYSWDADKKQAINTVIKVSGEISASNQFAGGMFGQNNAAAQLKIEDGVMEANIIKAVEGYAGGLVGKTNKKLIVGQANKTEASHSIVSVIISEKLSSAFAAGGIVGSNTNNAEVNIVNGPMMGTSTASVLCSAVNVNVKAFECTKASVKDTYFAKGQNGNDQQAQKAGTMSNIIGQLDGTIRITEGMSTARYAQDVIGDPEGTPVPTLTVVDNLQSAMKLAVCYDMHPDRGGNTGVDVGTYWGDYNGYVGWGQSGSFILNGKYMRADQEDGYNLYKAPGAVYNNAKSKNAPAAE